MTSRKIVLHALRLKAARCQNQGKSDTPAVTVTFPFNDVERANLVPDLNFRGAK